MITLEIAFKVSNSSYCNSCKHLPTCAKAKNKDYDWSFGCKSWLPIDFSIDIYSP